MYDAWEFVHSDRDRCTYRLQVAEGALYRVVGRDVDERQLVFAPAPPEPPAASPGRPFSRLNRAEFLHALETRREAAAQLRETLWLLRQDEGVEPGQPLVHRDGAMLQATLDQEASDLDRLADLLHAHPEWAEEPEAELRAVVGAAALATMVAGAEA